MIRYPKLLVHSRKSSQRAFKTKMNTVVLNFLSVSVVGKALVPKLSQKENSFPRDL